MNFDDVEPMQTGNQPCPFCGGTYFATTDGGGQVLQTMPPCRKYLQLDPIDFLVAAREARGIDLPS